MATQLILGGTGFIGSHLANVLAKRGDHVIAVGRRPTAALDLSGVEQCQIDLYACRQTALEELVARADVIYHLAWSSFAATAESAPDRDLQANVGFTVRLLQAARFSGPKIIFCSSGGTVYGPSRELLIEEDHLLRPITAYGAGKAAAEIYADLYRRAHGLDVRVARLANPYGLGQAPERMQGAVSRFAAEAVGGRKLEIWGDGSVIRDYLHVDDAVSALLKLAEATRDKLETASTFNIGSGHGTSLKELIQLLGDLLGRQIEVCYKDGRRIDVARNVLSIERAAKTLDWRPSLNLRDGVTRLIGDLQNIVQDDSR